MLKRLPKAMRSKALAITLDLKVVGKERFSQDDLTMTWDRGTEACVVTIKKAFLKECVASHQQLRAPPAVHCDMRLSRVLRSMSRHVAAPTRSFAQEGDRVAHEDRGHVHHLSLIHI